MNDWMFKATPHLADIDASNNQIAKISDQIDLLKNSLKIFKVSKNWLAEIPNNFVHLRVLEILKLDENMLTELPFMFNRLTSLRRLNLNNNWIQEISEEICQIPALTQLQIGDNPIMTIPTSILLLENKLKYFEIDWLTYCSPPLIIK